MKRTYFVMYIPICIYLYAKHTIEHIYFSTKLKENVHVLDMSGNLFLNMYDTSDILLNL
jgi:hypothetical protein